MSDDDRGREPWPGPDSRFAVALLVVGVIAAIAGVSLAWVAIRLPGQWGPWLVGMAERSLRVFAPLLVILMVLGGVRTYRRLTGYQDDRRD